MLAYSNLTSMEIDQDLLNDPELATLVQQEQVQKAALDQELAEMKTQDSRIAQNISEVNADVDQISGQTTSLTQKVTSDLALLEQPSNEESQLEQEIAALDATLAKAKRLISTQQDNIRDLTVTTGQLKQQPIKLK